MNWLSLFAGPIGNIINNGIATAAGAVIAYSAAKGNPLGDMTNVVSMLALAASTAISGFAATQGVHIPIINAAQNGVVVVPSADAKKAGVAPVNGPLK